LNTATNGQGRFGQHGIGDDHYRFRGREGRDHATGTVRQIVMAAHAMIY
jgi:hypothetical protein